jgi:hypothetical protein
MDPFSALGYGFGLYIIMMYVVSITTGVLLAIFYLFPFIQVALTNERGNWLTRQFKNNPSAGPDEDALRKKLLAAAEPQQVYPIYKLLKFVLIFAGILAMVAGLLTIVLPEHTSGGLRKFLVFIPLIVGVGLYFFYKLVYLNHGIWREIAGAFLILGFGATASGAFEVFEMADWFRIDFLIYIILGFGLWVVFHLKSTVASFFYMLGVSVASQILGDLSQDNWYFLTHSIWLFAAGSLYFWLPRLRAAKEIEFKQLLFAILLFSNAIALVTNNTSGLVVPGMAVMLPTLYLFSKVYYRNATWIGGRPLEVMVILFVVLSAIGFCIPELVVEMQDSITLFKYYSFHKQIAYLILVVVAICGYILYQDHSSEEQKSVNLLIVFYPLGAFLLIYILGDYGTQFIANAFLLYLGYDYLMKGIKQKDVIQLAVAVVCIVVGLFIRLEAVIEDINEKEIIGLIVMVFGAVVIALAFYMRSKWNVTAPDSEQFQSVEDDFDELS